MLNRPSDCKGCPLDPIASGFMRPSLATSKDAYRVALVGEALGKDEAEEGAPFVGKAGFKLTRLIEWAGLERDKFDIWNVAWCRPPDNKLEGTSHEYKSIEHCRRVHWEKLIQRANVLVPMGNVPLHALTGRKGILRLRGYVQPGEGRHILPTVHPSFIQRGQSKYAAAFIHDIQKAVELSRYGLQTVSTNYAIDPTPGQALEWAKLYAQALDDGRKRGLVTRLVYDIETPGKGDDESEVDEGDTVDASYFIWRIGFSYSANSALTVPWKPEYLPAIRLLLQSDGEKVVWNAGFDNPRLAYNGVPVRGTIHDGMVAWHILHSDLPKGLAFVATFTCPWQPAWKHLSKQAPGLYNCIDADVEWRSMEVIERELRAAGLWDVYQRDVLDLDPILVWMTEMGMPIDEEIRFDRAKKLAERQSDVLSLLESLTPLAARKVEHVYAKPPRDVSNLLSRPALLTVRVCDRCGVRDPRKDHFKVFKKKENLCGGAQSVERVIEGTEYYRLQEYKPSRNSILRYQDVMGHPFVMTKDKKTGERKPTTNEKALKELMRKFPEDQLYPAILDYRELDKLAGTYIGRPNADV